jgi:rubrerythrin
MPVELSSREIINIAIGIERRGISFYDVMAKSTDDEASRAVFEGLVEMEREHLETFQGMLDQLNGSMPEERESDVHSEYIRALMDSAVFTDDLITGEMATQADTDIKAIELGISAEKDSLLFYYEIKDSLPPRMVPLLDRIITEEQTHLWQLSTIKKRLTENS